MLDTDPRSRVPGSPGRNPRRVGTPSPGEQLLIPSRALGWPCIWSFPRTLHPPSLSCSVFCLFVFLCPEGRVGTDGCHPCDMWLALPLRQEAACTLHRGPNSTGSGGTAAKQATGWGRKGVGMSILGGMAGEHGDGMPCLQPEREYMDFLWSCCKSPHAQRLQRMHTAHLTVQEVRGPTESTGAEIKVLAGLFLSASSRGESVSSRFSAARGRLHS